MSVDASLPDATDLVVIGGGIMGTSTAYFAAKETEFDVLLLDKDNIAAGSTSDSSAVLRHHYGSQEIYTKMAWWSHQFYREFEERIGESLSYQSNPLVRFDSANDEDTSYAEAGYELLKSRDIPVSRYTKEDFDERYPMLNLGDYDIAISDDTAGYSDGTDAATGFSRAAVREGATVLTDMEVVNIIEKNGTISAVETQDQTVKCQKVVLAAGPWTPQLAASVGVDVPITVEREQVLILDPPDEYTEAYQNLTPTTAPPGGQWYVRPDFGDNILVATHHSHDEVDPDTYKSHTDESTRIELSKQIDDFIPELAAADIQGEYCGIYSTTPDHDFIIDQAGPKGFYLTCGFSGHGFKHGPAVGRIMSDLITTNSTNFVDIEYFSLNRFDENPAGHGLPEDLA